MRVSKYRAAAAVVLAAAALVLARTQQQEHRTQIAAVIEAELVPVVSASGGTVAAVLVQEGAVVRPGDLLVRLRNDAVEQQEQVATAVADARQRLELLRDLPEASRSMLMQMHPLRQRAEAEYVAALQAYESADADSKAQAKQRLDRAAQERTRVAQRLASALKPRENEVLPSSPQTPDNLLQIKAPIAGRVETLQLRASDKILPRHPVLVLADDTRLHADVAMALPGEVVAVLPDGARVSCRTEALQPASSMPFRMRPLTRVFLPAGATLRPGTAITVLLP